MSRMTHADAAKRRLAAWTNSESSSWSGGLFVAVSAAVFLLGLGLVRTPVRGYVVQSLLVRRSTHGLDAANPDRIADEGSLRKLALDGDALRAAVREAGLAPSNTADVLALDAVVADVRSELAVDVAADSANDVRVRLALRHEDRESAQRLLDSLSRQFVEASTVAAAGPSNQPSAADRKMQWRVQESRHYERKSRQTLDNFLDEFFLTVRRPGSSSGGALASDKDGDGASDAMRAIHPEWASLQRHFEQLAEARAKMAANLQPQHPQLLQLDNEIAAVRQRWMETPKYDLRLADETLSADSPAAVGSSNRTSDGGRASIPGDTSADSDRELVSLDASAWQKAWNDYQRLRDEYSQAAQSREEAEHRWAGVEFARQSSPPLATVWLWRPADVVSRIGGEASAARLVGLALASLLAGAIAVRTLPRAEASRGLATDVDADAEPVSESNAANEAATVPSDAPIAEANRVVAPTPDSNAVDSSSFEPNRDWRVDGAHASPGGRDGQPNRDRRVGGGAHVGAAQGTSMNGAPDPAAIQAGAAQSPKRRDVRPTSVRMRRREP